MAAKNDPQVRLLKSIGTGFWIKAIYSKFNSEKQLLTN